VRFVEPPSPVQAPNSTGSKHVGHLDLENAAAGARHACHELDVIPELLQEAGELLANSTLGSHLLPHLRVARIGDWIRDLDAVCPGGHRKSHRDGEHHSAGSGKPDIYLRWERGWMVDKPGGMSIR
jgi:hypothetical protein